MDAIARRSLEKRLGDFLGFDDDGLSDILEHLLTIESEADLRDYLSQLLGSEDDDMREFVKDIGRFQKGEPIQGIDEEEAKAKVPTKPETPIIAEAKSTTANSSYTAAKGKKATGVQNKKINPSAAAKPQAAAATQQTVATTTKNAVKATTPDATPKETEPSQTNITPATKPPPSPPKKKKYALPPRGQAKRNCGCFGTLHKPLTNCLYCGRIACQEEGYDFCPFCGYLVEEVTAPVEGDLTRYVTLCYVYMLCVANSCADGLSLSTSEYPSHTHPRHLFHN